MNFYDFVAMSSEGFFIDLKPGYVIKVRDDLAYEIGRYYGNFGGYYFFIWERQPTGVWQVKLNANIY